MSQSSARAATGPNWSLIAALYCDLVPVPAGWQLSSCGPQPGDTLVVVFTFQ